MIELALGPDVVTKLLPHRRPFLMVDGVVAWARGAQPRMKAYRNVSANEPVFDGHFPGVHLWPGVYTIEGMGQTANLLTVIDRIVTELVAHGATVDDAVGALRALDRSRRTIAEPHPVAVALEAKLAEADPLANGGMSAAVDVKLLRPVFAGQRIDYEVTLTHRLEGLLRFDVHAAVGGHPVAKGTMHGTLGVARR